MIILNGKETLSQLYEEFESARADSFDNWRLTRGVYDHGEDGGGVGHVDIFTVTGDVMAKVIGVCETTVTEGAATSNMSLGTEDDPAVLIPSTPSATLEAEEIWHDATPAEKAEKVDIYGETAFITNGQDIRLTIADEDISAGKINFYCFWKPLSPNGNVAAA